VRDHAYFLEFLISWWAVFILTLYMTNCSRTDDLEGDLQTLSWRQHRSHGKGHVFSTTCGGSCIIDSRQRIAEGPDSELGHRAWKVRNEQRSGRTTCPNCHRNKSSTTLGDEKLAIRWIKLFQSRGIIIAQSYCLDHMALWWANLFLFPLLFNPEHHGATWRLSQSLNDKSITHGLRSGIQPGCIWIEAPVSHSH
jgi:predicted secreted protein